MFTTIEPRLIARLNEPTEFSASSPSLELPPLHDPNILKASGRSHVLEPYANDRSTKQASRSQLQPPHLRSTFEEDEVVLLGSDEHQKSRRESPVPERALGGSSPQSLRKILGDDRPSDQSLKKRHMVESSMDEFVQLPQPPKKQKAAKHVVPPIIIGLFEPPLQATLYPPIAEGSFNDNHGRSSMGTETSQTQNATDRVIATQTTAVPEKKKRSKDKKNVKARKKWTDAETNNLLLGVHKHGVGKWSDILDDPSFSFNGRSGVDLKDRFRTCCPVELQGENHKSKITLQQGAKTQILTSGLDTQKSGLMSENILIDHESVVASSIIDDVEDPSPPRLRKSRAHRKELTDLAELGIEGPFRKSMRRERRPFTETDDREILEGYNIYGPAWTRIQRDPQFHLLGRKPTDLRDRFRNKYPERFGAGEGPSSAPKTSKQGMENSAGSASRTATSTQTSNPSRERLTLDQIITSDHDASSSRAINRQAQLSLWGLKDPPLESSGLIEQVDALPFGHSFDWAETITAPFATSMGEMDISRLLLDEPLERQ